MFFADVLHFLEMIIIFKIGSAMNKKKIFIFLIISLIISAAIAKFSSTFSLDEKLISIQSKELLYDFDKSIPEEPAEIQSLLLDYIDDKDYFYKMLIAISRYQDMAREVIIIYGNDDDFISTFKEYGEAVIPAIYYFVQNEITSLTLMQKAGEGIASLQRTAESFLGYFSGNEKAAEEEDVQTEAKKLGPLERGHYAINFTKQEGYDFVGQFAVDSNNQVKWNQTERITEGLTSFFTSGVKSIEKKHDLNQEITGSDALWAIADAAVLVSAVKVARLGKSAAQASKVGKGEQLGKSANILSDTGRLGKNVAQIGESGGALRKSAVISKHLFSKTKYIKKFGKIGAYIGSAVLVVKYPSLISAAVVSFAKLLGIPPYIALFVFWSFVIFFFLYPVMWVLKPIVAVLYHSIRWTDGAFKSYKKTESQSPQAAAA